MERNIESVRIRARRLVLGSAAVVVVLLASNRAHAHDLKMMVEVQDTVTVEAWFDDDTPAQQARVKVVNSELDEVASGTTDDRGVWQFSKPGPGRYRVTVESIGHKQSVHFTVSGADEPAAPTTVEPESRWSNRLGLIVGLTMTLGGSLAFLLLRKRRSVASAPPPAAHP